MDGRKAEITVDLVLQARAKMSDNKVNGPAEDAVVSEMIKQLLLEKIYTITKCFQERFMGQMELCSCENQTQNQRRRSEVTGHFSLTSVMSKWYASCIMLRLGERGQRT